jgi:hypothetical protein
LDRDVGVVAARGVAHDLSADVLRAIGLQHLEHDACRVDAFVGRRVDEAAFDAHEAAGIERHRMCARMVSARRPLSVISALSLLPACAATTARKPRSFEVRAASVGVREIASVAAKPRSVDRPKFLRAHRQHDIGDDPHPEAVLAQERNCNEMSD